MRTRIQVPDIPSVTIPTEYEQPTGQPVPPTTRVPPVKVPVEPVTDAFERQVRATIAKLAKTVAVDVPLTAQGEELRTQVSAQIAAIERTLKAEIPTDPTGAAEYRRKLAAMVNEASRGVRANIRADVDQGALNRVTNALRSIIGLGNRSSGTFDGLSGSVSGLGSNLSRVSLVGSNGFAAIASKASLVFTVLGALNFVIPGIVTGVSLLAGTAVAAIGAITAGLAGLPVLLTTLIAPIGVLALGFDGVKKAAESLSDEFTELQRIASVAFEFGMRPVFDRLAGIFPTLNVGVGLVADATSRFALALADVVASERGLNSLRSAFVGVETALDRMRPGVARLFQSLLDIAGTRVLYEILGDTIGGVTDRFGAMLDRLRESGDIETALRQVENVLFSVVDLVSLLAEGAVDFFINAGPGLTAFFESLTRTLSRVDWVSLGESFGRMLARIGAAIEAVPPETWRELGDAIGEMIDTFISSLEDGGLAQSIELLTRLVQGLNVIINGIKSELGPLADAVSFVLDLPGQIGGAFESAAPHVESALGSVKDTVSSTLSDLPGVVEDTLTDLPGTIGGFFTQAKDTVSTTLQETADLAGEKATSIGTSIVDTISALPGQVGEFFSELPYTVGYWLGYTATSAYLFAQDIVSNILGVLADLPAKVEAIIIDVVGRTIRFFAQLPGWLAEKAKEAVDSVVGFFSELPGKIEAIIIDVVGRTTRFFAQLPGMLLELGKQAVGAVVFAFTELPGKVLAIIGRLISDILNFFKELPGKLYRAGVDAVQGFIDGVQSLAGKALNAVKAFVTGAGDGARDALEERSPSRVFRRIGQDAGKGLELGFLDSTSGAVAAIRALIGNIQQALPADLGERLAAAVQTVAARVAVAVDARSGLTDAATRSGVGTGTDRLDAAGVAAALAAVLPGLRLAFVGPSVVEIVDDEHRKQDRR